MSDMDLSTRVFLSYRRNDTKALSRLIYQSLAEHFGKERVFFDIDNIPIGEDFHAHLADQVARCTVLLAVIGDRWGVGEVFGDGDFVRIEVRSALALGIPVVPIFAEGARPPPLAQVPIDLQPLLRRNGLPVDSGRDFRSHMSSVVTQVERLSKQRLGRLQQEQAAKVQELERLAKLEAERVAKLEAERVARLEEEARAERFAAVEQSTVDVEERSESDDRPEVLRSPDAENLQPRSIESLEPVELSESTSSGAHRRRVAVAMTAGGVLAIALAAWAAQSPPSVTLDIRAAGIDGAPLQAFRVDIDGRAVCSASPCVIPSTPGRRVAKVRAAGYNEKVVTLDVTEDTNPKLVSLLLDAQQGRLEFDKEIPGTILSVDGKAVDGFPKTMELAAGEHSVRLEQAGYDVFEQRIVLPPGGTVQMAPQLIPSLRRATFRLGTNAAGAKLVAIINSTRQVLEGPPYALDVSASSETRIVASKAGFKDVELSLSFEPTEREHEFEISFEGAATPSNVPSGTNTARTVAGRLAPEQIQAVVGENRASLRSCYQEGLRRNPSLEGRVSVRFVIGLDGSVSNVSNDGSDLPDPAVVSCVLSKAKEWRFPRPEGGTVTAVYPFLFKRE